MTLEKYTALTGITVSSNDEALVTAQLNRSQLILENLLGFTLNPKKVSENLYNEQGKTQLECASCPNVDTENLLARDSVKYGYRLYSYDHRDKYFYVDPFCGVNKIKLVVGRVTVKTFDADEFRVNYGRDGMAKYIENCQTNLCQCGCKDCVQLAVDANWLWRVEKQIPSDLLQVWADMATYYTDCKRNIKSESIGGVHSYTKFDNDKVEELSSSLSVIKRYAGPYGAVNRTVTV